MQLWKEYAKDYMALLKPVSPKTDAKENKEEKQNECAPDTTADAPQNRKPLGAIEATREESEKKRSQQAEPAKKGFQIPQDLD